MDELDARSNCTKSQIWEAGYKGSGAMEDCSRALYNFGLDSNGIWTQLGTAYAEEQYERENMGQASSFAVQCL